MHLIVPFAGVLSDAGRQALHTLTLPHLERLLAQLTPATRDTGDEMSMSPPHERAHAQALGWPVADGALPWAAQLAQRHGLPTDAAWGLLTPVHLHLGTEQVSLGDPQALGLDEAASRAVFAAVQPLFESEGIALHWLAPLQWLAAHDSLAALPTASLDRVIGRNIDLWLPALRQSRLFSRLQNEVQMLLYTHPLTEAREAAGQLPVNSFWLNACGHYLPPAGDAPVVDARLRQPALAEDWAAWCDAWRTLDAGPIADAVRSSAPFTLTLAGERHAQRYERAQRGLWQRVAARWRAARATTALEAL